MKTLLVPISSDRRQSVSTAGDLRSTALQQILKPACLVLVTMAGFGLGAARATPREFISGTSLTSGSNYSPTGTLAPTDNIVFDSGSTVSTSLTITAATLNIEDIAFSTATTATISNTTSGSTPSTLELNGGRGTTTPLLDENSTKTLSIKNGSAGALNLLLGVSGSFEIDSSGSLTISSNINQVSAGTSLTITAGANGTGTVNLSGTNSFSGGLVAAGGEVDVVNDANFGAAGGSITINGGRIGVGTNSFTVDPTRNVYLGANPTGGSATGTLSIKGSVTTTFDQGFQNLSGSTGDLVKQGGGTLALGGVSTYSGKTFLNNGITQLVVNGTTSTGNLPATTTLYIGQSASANTGTFDLNGINQQINGLNSVTGASNTTTNTLTSTNSTVTATLTLNGSGTYAFGDGSATNSGNITGAVAINKTGSGLQTFGGNNTYTGSTTVSGGTLIVGTSTTPADKALGGTSGVFINGGGTLQMGAVNQFNATTPTPVQLGGTAASAATFSVNGNSQGSTTANGVGALTLGAASANNVLDFNSKNGVVTFASFTPNGATLTINNYLSNSGASGGPDELIFAQDESANLGSFVFAGYGTATEASLGGGFYEVFPGVTAVPEPATVFGGLLLVGALGWNQRRRSSGWLAVGRRAVPAV